LAFTIASSWGDRLTFIVMASPAEAEAEIYIHASRPGKACQSLAGSMIGKGLLILREGPFLETGFQALQGQHLLLQPQGGRYIDA
jgi:hypothetical protein